MSTLKRFTEKTVVVTGAILSVDGGTTAASGQPNFI